MVRMLPPLARYRHERTKIVVHLSLAALAIGVAAARLS